MVAETGEEISLVQLQRLQPQRQPFLLSGRLSLPAQAEKFLCVQGEGDPGIPQVTAVLADERLPSGPLAQLVQTGAGPVKDCFQRVEGADPLFHALPEQIGELRIGRRLAPSLGQTGQQQAQLAGTVGDGDRSVPAANGHLAQSLDIQCGNGHRVPPGLGTNVRRAPFFPE